MSAWFTTSFGPFIGELLFRYTQKIFTFGHPSLTVSGVLLTIAFSIMLGFIVPAILPGAHAWHKGYNLYNGGLAFGLFGFFLFNFFYNTMGIDPSSKLTRFNPVYEQFGPLLSTVRQLLLPDSVRHLHRNRILLKWQKFQGLWRADPGHRSSE